MARRSQSIRESDVRAMLQILGEVGTLPMDPSERTRHLVRRIADLIGAQAAWSTRWRCDRPGAPVQPYAIFTNDAWSPGQVSAAIDVAADDPLHGIVADDLFARGGRRSTFVTSQLDAGRSRSRVEAQERMVAATGGDIDVIVNVPAEQAGHYAALGLQRPRGSRRFSAREVQLATLLWEQATAIHREPVTVRSTMWGARLSPRLQQVLELVLIGAGHKQVARRLGISEHTVNDHLKAIYKRFGVSGKAELMACFVRR